MTITVIDIGAVASADEGDAEVARFLDADTVGARTVEGIAYRLAPGGKLAPLEDAARYQLLYVTAGRVSALYQGQQHDLAPGQGVYCDPGESCTIENRTKTPAAFYRFVIQVPPQPRD